MVHRRSRKNVRIAFAQETLGNHCNNIARSFKQGSKIKKVVGKQSDISKSDHVLFVNLRRSSSRLRLRALYYGYIAGSFKTDDPIIWSDPYSAKPLSMSLTWTLWTPMDTNALCLKCEWKSHANAMNIISFSVGSTNSCAQFLPVLVSGLALCFRCCPQASEKVMIYCSMKIIEYECDLNMNMLLWDDLELPCEVSVA